ncbi:MAG: hypothetical protein ABIT38_10630 [Gemmatimonadaceae bacterium]
MALTPLPPTPGGGSAGTPDDGRGGGIAYRIAAALGTSARQLSSSGGTLELSLSTQENSRAQSSTLLTDAVMRAHAVGESQPEATFGAFVDGVQESRTVAYLGLVPVVHARSAAVVRARVGRRLVTWGDGARVSEVVCLPLGVCGVAAGDALTARGFRVLDTTDDASMSDDVHPQQLQRRAVHLVQRERESLERDLAEQWCRSAVSARDMDAADGSGSALYIDGGLPSPAVVLSSRLAIGVIKSHHTLYATGSALSTVMSLGAGERSSVFVVHTKWREPVASWYLRLRDAKGREPLWALARIEASLPTLHDSGHTPDEWADEISCWVLTESSPLALPDSRWDTMAYGIRDCEVYLRATLGQLR